MKKVLLAALLLLTTVVAQAEDKGDKLKSYNYVEAQGGLGWTVTNAKIDKLLMPQFGLSFGRFPLPEVGFRLHVEGIQAKGRYEFLDRDYKWNYLTADADLLVNLLNFFSDNYSRPLNIMLVGGVGLTPSWKNDDHKAIVVEHPELATWAWTGSDNKLIYNARVGLRFETDVTKPLGISLEVDANNKSDRFNSKVSNGHDWMITGKVGVAYRFGHKYQREEPVAEPKVVAPEPEPAPVPVPVEPVVEKKEEPKPQPVVKKESLREEIFYVICKSDPTVSGTSQLQRVADFMKKYKDAKVQIVGYADKGTGNPEINKMYAERRAAECKDALVNRYGCDAARILIDSKGDTVQPFQENDKNRCVIIGSEAQYTVYE